MKVLLTKRVLLFPFASFLCAAISASSGVIRQILRSGTSIGANLAEASFAVSKKDFFSKVHISLKECSETWYWLRLLHATSCLTDQQFESMKQDCLELMRLLTATTKTLSKQSV